LCLFLWLFPGCLFSAPSLSVAEADEMYARNEFRQAATLYQAVIDSGYRSASLYYNLGNAHFKLNNLPRAILNYERAVRLAPRDEAIQFNLELSRSLIYDRIEPVPEMFLIVWARQVRDLMSVAAWSWLSVVLFVLFLGAALSFFFRPMGRLRYLSFWAGFCFLFMSLATFTGAWFQYKHITATDAAIVFSPVVTVKSAPGEGGTNLFILHEGTRVLIDDEVGEWLEIRIPDGTRGWLRKSDVEII